MTLLLRPAQAHDHQLIAEILIQSRAAFMPYAPSVHAEADVRAWVRTKLIPAGGTTVAQRGGEVVGVLAVSRQESFGSIDQMYVQPSLVGQGIGTELLRHALAALKAPIRLYTFQANVNARRFYERHGFRPIQFTDGAQNEERCPDVLYEFDGTPHG